MADDLRCAMCGGAGSETAVYTGEKIQMYTAVQLRNTRQRTKPILHQVKENSNGDLIIFEITDPNLPLHPRCTHDWLAEHQDQALAAGPEAW